MNDSAIKTLRAAYLDDPTYVPVSVDQMAVVTALMDYLAGSRRPQVTKALVTLAGIRVLGDEQLTIGGEAYVALAWRESQG